MSKTRRIQPTGEIDKRIPGNQQETRPTKPRRFTRIYLTIHIFVQ